MPRTPVTRINGAFQVQANTATNLKNNGFYAPQLTTAQIAGISVGTLMNGAIVYNTTTGSYQIYQARDFAAPTVYTWANLISSPMKAYLDDATAVANILKKDYGTHNFKPFIEALVAELKPSH